MKNFADLYSDYLISSSSYTTSTGMANLLSIKHNKITRELSKGDLTVNFCGSNPKFMFKKWRNSGCLYDAF